LYNVSSPNSPVPLNDYAASMIDIQYGEYVCLLARHSTRGNVCGPITGTNAYRTRVGVEACPGDSGGGWYLPGGGYRVAYGIHEVSDDGCHVAGGSSMFSPVPTVHQWFDSTSAAQVRIDTR
jgi:streptogrisin C